MGRKWSSLKSRPPAVVKYDTIQHNTIKYGLLSLWSNYQQTHSYFYCLEGSPNMSNHLERCRTDVMLSHGKNLLIRLPGRIHSHMKCETVPTMLGMKVISPHIIMMQVQYRNSLPIKLKLCYFTQKINLGHWKVFNPLRPELCFKFLKNIKVHFPSSWGFYKWKRNCIIAFIVILFYLFFLSIPMDIRSKQMYFPKMYQHEIN